MRLTVGTGPIGLLALSLGALAGCDTSPPPSAAPPPVAEDGGGTCTADNAKPLLGQKASEDTGARAMALTGARNLRWGWPGAAFTMDYRQDRVNVIYDENRTIIEITCG